MLTSESCWSSQMTDGGKETRRAVTLDIVTDIKQSGRDIELEHLNCRAWASGWLSLHSGNNVAGVKENGPLLSILAIPSRPCTW